MAEKKVYNDLVHKQGPNHTFRPLLYTPVTRLTEHWFTHSAGKCGRHEELMFKCGMQGSREQMFKRCARELEDFEECMYQTKQIARYQAIQKERLKQGKYEGPPARGIFMHEPVPYPNIGSHW